MQYQCGLCSYRYDEARGDPAQGIPAGTPWLALPDGWCCPECGVSGSEFIEVMAEMASFIPSPCCPPVQSLVAVRRHGPGLELTLESGQTLQVDIAWSAIGLTPRTALAQAAGIAVGRANTPTRAGARYWDTQEEVCGFAAIVGEVQNARALNSRIATPALGEAAA